eukprot:2940091-Prymnesium_polylepis.1
MAQEQLTANFLERATQLQEMDVEPKGSCWILSAISSIAGALENRKTPSCRDRLLDHYLRREAIWRPMQLRAKAKWGELENPECAHLMRSLSKLQVVPTQGKRRQQPRDGWVPDGGWTGTFAFDFLVM